VDDEREELRVLLCRDPSDGLREGGEEADERLCHGVLVRAVNVKLEIE
jgi:hypothetical protein